MRYDTLLLQKTSTSDVRGALVGAQLLERPIRILRPNPDELASHGQALRSGTAVPVGSVEFVRAALCAAGVTEPPWNCYPPELQRWLGRSVLRATAGVISGRWFVKPAAQIKLFDGFVLDTERTSLLDAHGQAQLAALRQVSAATPVWLCEPVQWLSEMRFYVRERQVIGFARYDPDGAEDAPLPDRKTVDQAAAALPFDHPCALDFGVLRSGETALVELNDAWGLGLYAGALAPRTWIDFLAARWTSLVSSPSTPPTVACHAPVPTTPLISEPYA
ncbi:MAG: ATP-grasp domain-containing protein [Burkholderiaceae bacterium]|nr:ATP-grasp domain-containing protein [Burkholderiaceae bacterium]